MASLNLTVEDSSAMIHYDPAGAWTNPGDDPLSQSYSGASFHTTSTKGATATVQFNGTGIHFFAGSRPNYGSFQLKVDGNVVAQGPVASSSQQPEFNKLIASSTGLSNGPHTAVLENTSGSPIDLDRVDLLTEIGLPGSTLSTTTYDDINPAFVYSPSIADWRVNDAQGFTNNTLHYSNNPQASVSLTWDGGEAFSIWTTAAPDHANFELKLDGQSLMNCSGGAGTVTAVRSNTLMYFGALGSGSHTLSVSATGGGPYLDLDAVQVYSTTGGSSATPGSGTPGSASSGNGRRALSAGAIAGIVISVLAAIFLILGLLFFLLRRRRRSTPRDHSSEVSSQNMTETGSNRFYVQNSRPVSSSSSFFALDRGEPADNVSIHSTTPMIPVSESSFSDIAVNNGVTVASNRGASRPARTQHQSVHVEVVYPAEQTITYAM